MVRATSVIAILLIAARSFADTPDPSGSAPPATPQSVSATLQVVPRISAEDFGALPFMSGPKLSPSGKQVVARVFTKGVLKLAVFNVGVATAVSSVVAIPEGRDLLWYRWAGEDRLLISFGKAERFKGEDVYMTRLLMFEPSSNKASFIGRKHEGFDGDTVIHVDQDGRSLLLSVQETIYDYPSVWRVDLATVEMERIVKSQTGVWEWFADAGGTVRAGIGYAGTRWWLLYRKTADAKFERINKRRASDDEEDGDVERFIPIDGSDKGYAVANKKTGRYGVYYYDFANDTIGDAIFEHPQVDIDDFYQSEQGAIEAVFYTDDRSRVAWLNPRMKTIQAEIDGAFPDRVNRVVSLNRNGDTMIVWTGAASDPGRYYVYRLDTGKLYLLVNPYDRLQDKQLATVQSVSYRARDGLDIPAYLTLPPGVEAKALPLIVMPHGGPFTRDEWSYDVWPQFLANRGYLVLQPNYRGSTGYGKSFVEKGVGQWGRGMQDDVDDGVKWLVEQGKADPKRVCIMGASYGGYAAMWAAARNPDTYRCAISFAGISDVAAMLRYDRKSFSAPRYFRNWREKVQGDSNFELDTVSPLRAVDRITIPLLIAHGDKDENVPVAQSKKLHEVLTKSGKPHEYVVYEGEGHGLKDPQHAIDFLKRVDAFLGTHNPVENPARP